MSLVYIVELVCSTTEYEEILGKFECLNKSYEYIQDYSNQFRYTLVKEYTHLSEDQRNGSIIAINNNKKPTKFIYIRSEVNKRRKLTM